MATIRKLEKMHLLFGEKVGCRCGDCSNLCIYRFEDFRKCSVYGCTSSEASDWAKKWTACGMFNKSYSGPPVMQIKLQPSAPPVYQVPGQVSLFDGDSAKGGSAQ